MQEHNTYEAYFRDAMLPCARLNLAHTTLKPLTSSIEALNQGQYFYSREDNMKISFSIKRSPLPGKLILDNKITVFI